jgi:hypothetical protein
LRQKEPFSRSKGNRLPPDFSEEERRARKVATPKSKRKSFMDQPPCPPPAGSLPSFPGPVGFQGDIAVIALDNVFQLIDLAGLSGRLEVRAQENGGTFYFVNGVFIYGTLQVHPRRIGSILLDSGLISEQQLQECLELHKHEHQRRPRGQILLDRGYVDPARLDVFLQQQIREAFYASLSWRQGSFAYYPGEVAHPATIQLRERVDHLLLEGMVYLDSHAHP